jgi:YVTN family beta-propeller protein
MKGLLLLAVAAVASMGVVAVALANGPTTAAQPVHDHSTHVHAATQAGCDHAAHIHPSAAHAECLRAEQTLAGTPSSDEDRDVMDLTDEPGNWFRSQRSGSPLSVVPVGGRVDFVGGHLTNTRHTATLVNKPPSSRLVVDQDDAKNGGIASAEFDVPGVYLFLCKVHPYMTGVVAVTDASGNIPPVTAQQLPFIGHLGVPSLPATTVLAVLPAVAPTDAEKQEKWDLGQTTPPFEPPVPGVGEVWVDTQFEAVARQTDDRGVAKPGTISVVDAATWNVEREVDGLDPQARFRWNNPHNMWADTLLRTVYNGHWFGRWHNKIARATGDVLTTVDVGHAPTHTVTNPNEASPHFERLTLPLSADNIFRELEDPAFGSLQEIIDSDPTGVGRNHPHGQWTTTDGRKDVFPNVFKGFGTQGSVSIVREPGHEIVRELRAAAMQMPVATGIQPVSRGNKTYVANIVSGQVSVIDLNTNSHVKDIPVTLTPSCESGPQFDIFDTLQAPIQLPVSPDGRFVGVAVLSLTTVARPCTGSSDHIAIIDTATDTVVKFLGVPTESGKANGAHGANFGAKLGGGYYLHVASQFSNKLTVVDLDPNGDGSAADAAVAGRVLLANGAPGGPRTTDGSGGQGIKPLPNVYDGWVQDTVARTAQTDPEVQGWIAPNDAVSEESRWAVVRARRTRPLVTR